MNGVFVPDIPRMNTAIAEWLACMVFVLVLRRRFRPTATIVLSVAALGIAVGFQRIAGMLPLFLWIPGMLSATGLMYCIIFCICKISPQEALICTARAFILAEFAASLEWQMNYYLASGRGFSFVFAPVFMMTLNFSVVYITAFLIERRYRKLNIQFDVTARTVAAAVAVGAVIFLLSNMSFISRNTPLSGSYASDIFLIRTLVDFCGMVLFYSIQEQRLWMHARLEISAMHNMLNRQYEQYRFSKENMDFLNHRYHDLKHQIIALKAEANPEKKIEYLEKMEVAIQHFETQYNTGNKALDILLSGKSKQIVENGMNFTCVADGTLLDKIEIIDICSIVGNALDNAIESIMQLSDPEKKIIKVAIFAQSNFLLMRFENYFESQLNFEDGDIATTKNDKRAHGFGIRSIKNAAEKYGGNVKIVTDDHWFTLCVLIPLAENE